MHEKVKKAIEKLADALHCRPLDLLKERDILCFLRKTLLEEFGGTVAVRVDEDDMPGKKSSRRTAFHGKTRSSNGSWARSGESVWIT